MTAILHVMATHHPRARIDRQAGRREDVLPHPFPTRGRILAIQRIAQIYLAMAGGQVLAVEFANPLEMLAQGRRHARRQHRHAILEALAVAHQDFAAFEPHVLHPQPQAFHDAQAGAIEQPRNQAVAALQPRQHGHDLGGGQHHRQPLGRFGRLDIVEPGQFDVQHLAIQEQQGALGLVLGRSRYPPGHRQMGQKLLHLLRAHVFRMALAKIPDKSLNPIQIGLFRPNAVMLEANPALTCSNSRDAAADSVGDGIHGIFGPTRFD